MRRAAAIAGVGASGMLAYTAVSAIRHNMNTGVDVAAIDIVSVVLAAAGLVGSGYLAIKG